MQSTNDTKYLIPELKDKVPTIMQDFQKLQKGYYLKVVFTYRSPKRQLEAYNRGNSTKDGYHSFSRHNFLPSFAVDFWVYDGKTDTPLIKPEHFLLYRPIGIIAEGLNLFWGGWWKHLCDGMHVEIPKGYRTAMVQSLLNKYYGEKILKPDGIWGKHTTQVWSEFCYNHSESFKKKYLIEHSKHLNPVGWLILWNNTHTNYQFSFDEV